MTRQLQDAYIVAATRTPVGKAPRGAFRHTRPDSMLAHVLTSHQKALAAQASGEFAAEISPYPIHDDMPDVASGRIVGQSRTFERDEGPRADTSAEGLAKLRPVFAAKGSVTAGNSSQMSDGAGAVIVVSEKIVKELALTPLARWVAFAVAGVAPEVMGVGPIAAIPKVLRTTGIAQD